MAWEPMSEESMMMDEERKDPPIEPQDFLGGVTIVDIGDVRVARGLTRRHHSSCPHRRLVYDNKERRVWCRDCERDIEGYDAFLLLVEGYDATLKAVKRREDAVAEAERFQIRSRAAKVVDEAWRSRKTVPSCPHCHHGLFPEDFKDGCGHVGKQYAAARLGRKPPHD